MLSVVLWAPSWPVRYSYIFLSHITEKSSIWTIHALDYIMQHAKADLDWSGIDNLVMWFDSGPHFRSARVLASAASRWTRAWANTVQVIFGCECHHKSLCDGIFGQMKQAIRRAACSEWVVTAADAMRVLQAAYTPGSRHGTLQHIILNFSPTKSRDEVDKEVLCLLARSLPVAIKSCHAYSFKVNDIRRVNLLSRCGRFLSGVTVRCHYYPTRRASEDTTTTQLRMCQVADKDAEMIAEELEEHLESDEPNLFLGWKCTYRTQTPEVPNLISTSRTLAKKQAGMLPLPAARRLFALR